MDNHTLQEIEVELNSSVLRDLGYDLKRNNLQKIIIPKTYDYDGRDSEKRAHVEDGKQRGYSKGVNSAYNGIMYIH